MDNTKMLDWNALAALGLFPESEEYVVWTGQPKHYIPFPGSIDRYGRGLNRFWMAYYVCLFLALKESFLTGRFIPGIMALLAILLIQVLPFYLKYYAVKRTLYVVTNQRIVLHIWDDFSEKTHVLRYDDFQRATFAMGVRPGTNWGTVYLMTGKDIGFWTHEILSGERRHHPTLECVENAEWLALKIEDIRRETMLARAQEAQTRNSTTPYT